MEWWSPWHGCHRISPGCLNCYVYARDVQYGKDSAVVTQTASFDLPLKRRRDGSCKLKPGEEIFTCGTSDFFLEEADGWRQEAWRMIRMRPDLKFMIITKRIHRFFVSLPDDWGEGYENVTIGCTCEDQLRADHRLPMFLKAPIRHRIVIAEPLLEEIDFTPYLDRSKLQEVSVGGESGQHGRLCRYEWVMSIREQCREAGVSFRFKQTGSRFEKNGKVYFIGRKLQISQARKAGIDG